jgi:hypothetical protein
MKTENEGNHPLRHRKACGVRKLRMVSEGGR